MPGTAAHADDDTAARLRLRDELARSGLKIAQPDDPPLFTRVPESSMRPMHWRWAELETFLQELGQVLDLRPGGDRRTLRLANPGLDFGTTPTFWASIQYINPGEVATAHRHTPDAFRFVMYGNGCRTTVDGENYAMSEGDLVLTPNWTWHDHVHNGDEPMIWLDVLDVSLIRKLENTFFDPYPQDVQPVGEQPEKSWREFGSGLLRPVGAAPAVQHNPLLVYSREQAEAALELAKGLAPDPCDDVILEYQNPAGGGPALPSMSMKTQVLRPGFHGLTYRHSGSKVYWVIDGAGTSFVGDERFDWGKGDFVAVPPWSPVRHVNDHDAEAKLFRVDDSPLYRTLNIYHEEITQ